MIPESEGSPGERNGSPFQYSFLENFIGRGAWQLQTIGSQRVRRDRATNTLEEVCLNNPEAISWLVNQYKATAGARSGFSPKPLTRACFTAFCPSFLQLTT